MAPIMPEPKLLQKYIRISRPSLRSGDTLTIFNEIIERRDSLYERQRRLNSWKVSTKTESHQQKNYQDAVEIIDWYTAKQPAGRLEPSAALW